MGKALLKSAYEHFTKYQVWLERQPLSEHSKRAYRSRLNHFLAYIVQSDAGKDVFKDGSERDYILKDYKRYLKNTHKASPSSVNGALAAADSFFQFLGLGPTKVKRESLPAEAPKALSKDEQRRLLHAAARARRPKDRAIVTLLFYTGIRISECAALDFDDVYAQGRKRRVIVRSGKGDRYREVPLNGDVCEALQVWLQERAQKFAGRETAEAFFLNQKGGRMTTSALDLIVRKVGHEAGLEISAHILRHTLVTMLVRKGNDLVLVAEIAGHKKLETTRRYSLPTAADKALALEGLIE